MKQMSSDEIRDGFLKFFESKQHRIVPSSSLVPGNDPTLLFVNAGMVQFKDVFLGSDKRDYSRATTSQKCMRISGKHNDLENVGPSPRHHTFFEMLGNFSFGDYFKKDAIKYAYELLTEVYGLPSDRLGFTVYETDDDAFSHWVDEVGVDPKRVARMGPKTNFWQMAETGPCGPTSEIHWDNSPELGTDGIIDALVAEDDRFLEIWNLVFMQFNRTEADPKHSGKYDVPLPAPGVDTGMGLERIVKVMQQADSNYDTDIFTDIMDATQEILGHSDKFRQDNYVAYRVIADHGRAASFLIADRVNPGNAGREYITRMLIRRAGRFADGMGVKEPFLYEVADAIINKMGPIFPELIDMREPIQQQIETEERQFLRTLDNALGVLTGYVDDLKQEKKSTLSGRDAFFLWSTLGLPVEITRDILKTDDFVINEQEFVEAREQHALDSDGGREGIDDASISRYRDIAAQLRSLGALPEAGVAYDPYDYSQFERTTKIIGLIKDGQLVDQVAEGDTVEIVLAETTFYVEAGGQMSDTGMLRTDDYEIELSDTRRPVAGLVIHAGTVVYGGAPKVGDQVTAIVNHTRRWDIMRNHTATHLLHAALHDVLGKGATQKGSLVAPDRLRFDFNHSKAVSPAQLDQISQQVNDLILENQTVRTENKTRDQAVAEGAMALFGEKYGDTVRTVIIGRNTTGDDRYSYELCGGTHVTTTAEIGPFLIISEGGSAAGVRRIEAVTGHEAQRIINERLALLKQASAIVGAQQPDELPNRINQRLDELSATQKELEAVQRQSALSELDDILDAAVEVAGVQVLAAEVTAANPDLLGEMADSYRNRVGSGVVVLGSNIDGGARIVVALTKDLVEKGLKASNVLRKVAKPIKGGGGGPNPAFAAGGGSHPDGMSDAMALVADVISEELSS